MPEDFRDILTRLQNDPETVTDVQILEHIQELFRCRGTEPCDEEYDPLISSLSFTKADFQRCDAHELKRAWTGFLKRAFGFETSWEWPCNFGLAQWYLFHDKPSHAIAVYEHLYTQIRRMELAEYEDTYERCLLKLLDLCIEEGLTERARHIAELIGDYYDDGLISVDAYANVLAEQAALRYREMRDVIEQDREEAKKNLGHKIGPLFAGLHDTTRKLVIDAELWSQDRLKGIDPIAAPLRWALAIESEFHHRVYEASKHRLDGILGEKRPKGRRTCGIGQMLMLVKETCSDPIKRPLVEREIPAWRKLLAVPDIVETLNVIKEHRDQIAHVTERGMYTQARCSEFVRRIRESGWIIKFMQAVQPAS